MKKGVPLTHRLAFAYSIKGFRGSSHFWRFARIFKVENSGDLVYLPNGFPLIVNNTDWIARTIYEGTYERPLINLLNKISVNGCFIDVGANIGVTLWNGMQNSGENASFIAIEPSEQCQSGLERTTKNIDKQGQILKIALGKENGMLIMHGLNNPEQSGGASLLAHDGLKGEDISVQVRKLDDLVFNGEISKPVSLLKIDTEGYEEQVLAGGKNLISGSKVLIFILEVSPSFGSVDWVRELYSEISIEYTFFRLVETGVIQKKARLVAVEIEEALSISEQWNLVIFRNDFLEAETGISSMIKRFKPREK